MMNYQLDCFTKNYTQARHQFLTACQSVEGTSTTYINRISGLGQDLYTDVFWSGSAKAKNLLVLISGTHGVEGYCGSAAQVDFLRCLPTLETETAVLLVHALNPYGFAFDRRVNEDNIDLNRNFIDFSRLPENPGYQTLKSVLTLQNLDQQSLTANHQELAAYRQDWGDVAYEQAVSGGQYHDAKGLFYGGRQASWSHRLIQQLIRLYAISERQKVIVLDIHSGLGPYGYGEVISDHQPGSPGAQWAQHCFAHNMTEPAAGTSSSVPKLGLMDYLWHDHLPDKSCYVTLEFGTFAVDTMFSLLQQENHCWHNAVSPAQKRMVQKALRAYFYPEYVDWQEMVLFRCQQIIAMSLHKLAHE